MDSSLKCNELIENGPNSYPPLCIHVKQTVLRYLEQLNGHEFGGLHALVMAEVEKPLLQATLEHAGYNQTKAAKALGLSRSTLRKKMEFYGLT